MRRHSKHRSGNNLLAGIALCVATITTAAPAFAYHGENLAKQAKVSLAKAKEIALGARTGKITDFELEKEIGGSGLRYSFDIKSGNQTFEVGVDARNGKILENKLEGPNPD